MLNSEEISVDKIKSGIGGYKKKATKEFVEAVRNDYETLCKENLELKEKLAILSEGVQYYKNMEKSLQKALVLAERTTSETMHAAEVKAVAMEKEAKARADVVKKEARIEAETYEKEAAAKAERMLREAKEKADMAIAEGNEELRRIHSQIMNLIQQYEQYKSQYKQLALAQMNVLESEAYNLDAPILKTLQQVVEQGGKAGVEKKIREEVQQDEVVQPVSVAEEQADVALEQQKNKKVYVDARGEVVEVHEFREVTIPHTGLDPFKNDEDEARDDIDFFDFDKDKGVERFDDDDDIPVSDMNNIAEVPEKPEELNNIMDVSKKESNTESDTKFFEFEDEEEKDRFISAIDELSKENSRNVMFDAVENDNSMMNEYQENAERNGCFDEKIGKEEKSQVSAAAMREIEKMQLERLRQEEEEHTKVLQQAQERKSYFTMGNGDNVPNDERKIEKDFYQNVTFGNEKPDLSLCDIKKQQEEENKHVPLPRASEENLYFSTSNNNANVSEEKEITTVNGECLSNLSAQKQQTGNNEKDMRTANIATEELYQNKEEEKTFFNEVMNSKNETGSFFEQFSDKVDEKVREDYDEDNKNSLDFELDFNNGMPTAHNKENGFKSFRDFKSEL